MSESRVDVQCVGEKKIIHETDWTATAVGGQRLFNILSLLKLYLNIFPHYFCAVISQDLFIPFAHLFPKHILYLFTYL